MSNHHHSFTPTTSKYGKTIPLISLFFYIPLFLFLSKHCQVNSLSSCRRARALTSATSAKWYEKLPSEAELIRSSSSDPSDPLERARHSRELPSVISQKMMNYTICIRYKAVFFAITTTKNCFAHEYKHYSMQWEISLNFMLDFKKIK